MVRSNRQLPVASIDQDRESNRSGPSEVVEGVERRSDGSAGVEDVIDEHDDPVSDVVRQGGFGEFSHGVGSEIIPVQSDVERSDRNVSSFDLGDQRCESLGERHAAGLNADQHDVTPFVAFYDLVRHPPEGPTHVGGVHHLWHGDPRRNETAPAGTANSLLMATLLPGLTGPC